ncbi:hypothetical protein PRIPAC_89481 [Pristionchus pacificus]|uniref:Uncharacterized protein n=1 Tax=Pristionchus pacificus TaxID=54126 RepID=A0A2A6CZ52_PRIPA|nr:hypothetical protein PRIPAC_89481 [Pristionchus pacificus]|eukprot:PDM83337.1 hypothetical protein PRIPAC_34969 [Pristionchus pacificus]
MKRQAVDVSCELCDCGRLGSNEPTLWRQTLLVHYTSESTTGSIQSPMIFPWIITVQGKLQNRKSEQERRDGLWLNEMITIAAFAENPPYLIQALKHMCNIACDYTQHNDDDCQSTPRTHYTTT